ncbi:MAG: phytanoyl-CoA dioxygenase family protein [Verrucomicrobiota bacterium]
MNQTTETNLSVAAVVPPAALSFYQEHGYYHAKQVLPQSLLKQCQTVLEAWINREVKKWKDEGRIRDLKEDLDFLYRFNELWLDAGRPNYERSPRKSLVEVMPQQVFEIIQHPALLDLAEGFLGTNELVSHGIWNSRPKTPDSEHTDTPWHQDGQYFRDQAHIDIMTIWFPLHRVSAAGSCLAVAPDYRGPKLHENYEYENGFIGIRREETRKLPTLPIEMEPGDALCFPQVTPHRAMPNTSGAMRWSMDMRFVATDKAMFPALEQGMIARSSDPDKIISFEEWLRKWKSPETW